MSDEVKITLYKYAEIDTEDDWGLLEIIPENKTIVPETPVFPVKKVILPFVKVEEEIIEEKIIKKKPVLRLIPKTQKETYGKRRALLSGFT